MKKFLLASAILFSSHSLIAEEYNFNPKWNNIELNYNLMNIDDIDNFKPTGFSLKGTHVLNENIFVLGEYRQLKDDIFGIDIEQKNYSFGFGSQSNLNNNINMYGTLTYEHYEIENISENGFEISAGFRYSTNPNFVIDSSLSLLVLDNEEDLAFNLKGYYNLNKEFDLSLGYTFYENGGIFQTGIRYLF